MESLRVFALRPQVLHSQSSHSQVNVRSSALMKGTAGLTRPTTHKTAVLRVEGGPYGPEPAQVYLLVSFQTPFLFGGLLTRCSCKTVDEFASPLDPQGAKLGGYANKIQVYTPHIQNNSIQCIQTASKGLQ